MLRSVHKYNITLLNDIKENLRKERFTLFINQKTHTVNMSVLKLSIESMLVKCKNGANSVENSWVVALKKIKHAPIKWLTHSTPRYLSNRNESVCPYKDLYMKVHGSFIYKSQNLEITHMFIDSRLCKPSNYTMKKYSTIKRNGILIQ